MNAELGCISCQLECDSDHKQQDKVEVGVGVPQQKQWGRRGSMDD